MTSDRIRRRCPKCGSNSITGPFYEPENDRLRLICKCGKTWTTPTKEQTASDLRHMQDNRGKYD